MKQSQLVRFFGSGKEAAEHLGVSRSIISRFNESKPYFARLDSQHQIRAMNLSGGKLMPDEKALAFARNLFPNGVANSPLARLLDAQ